MASSIGNNLNVQFGAPVRPAANKPAATEAPVALQLQQDGTFLTGPTTSNFAPLAFKVTPQQLASEGLQNTLRGLGNSGFQVAITLVMAPELSTMPESRGSGALQERTTNLEQRTTKVESRTSDLEQNFGIIRDQIKQTSQPTYSAPVKTSSD